ncbi:hypothetical protein MEQU1_001796 [Malassezia equina]|uniref:UTP23 sensor motif region domain-containing protein n=1 Tax=Malassezia equina TaxID=1381935 RepID=A0AAF0J3L9_9BASI|nr:hypothetical protein MEQU1_001796 [Malassezia equina]
MRQKRAKSYRRLVHHILMAVDNTFAESLVRYQVQEPTKQLSLVLHGKVKPMMTQCCIAALYHAEKEAKGEDARRISATIALAKTWERRKCNHRETQPPSDCLASVIGPENRHRYMLAADDAEVRRTRRREVPGLPLLHYAQSVLILEPMSDVTERHIAHLEANKSAISAREQRLLAKSEEAPAAPDMAAPVKRKRAKEPNPLSPSIRSGAQWPAPAS